MVAPVETPPRDWNWIARSGSIAFHILFISFLLLQTKLFPYHPPTQSQIDLARQQLNFIYMPPDVRGLPPTPPPPRSPQMRIDPRILRQMAPPVVPQPVPAPKEPDRVLRDTPAEPAPELPVAPKPQPQTPPVISQQPQIIAESDENDVKLVRTGGASTVFYSVELKQVVSEEDMPAYATTKMTVKREFLRRVGDCLHSIRQIPKGRPLVHADYRRAVVQRFPYVIFYEYSNGDDTVTVYSVFHTSQDPKKWRDRLP